jgi:RNA recognition motif-containing protein
LSKKIYVGNLPFSAAESDVESLFAQHGEVVSVKVITDRETGRSRGFAFVEMDEEGAQTAIRELAGYEMDGRPLRVNEARERRPGGGRRGPPRRRE